MIEMDKNFVKNQSIFRFLVETKNCAVCMDEKNFKILKYLLEIFFVFRVLYRSETRTKKIVKFSLQALNIFTL